MPVDDWARFDPGAADLSLCTDLYQLTMAAAYHAGAPGARGSFEFLVRSLPTNRNFLVFAGLEQVLAALQEVAFDVEQIDYLAALPTFANVDREFFDYLGRLRFRCDIDTVPEGTIFFPGEPVLRVTGDLIEAQIVETLLLSILNFQIAIASKAARMRLVAGPEVQLAEFGTRRAHGPQAALWAARAAWLAGFDATSNVLAGQRFGIPVVGTMAHSFVMAAADEMQAFRDYLGVFPAHSILLIDTYDSLRGVERALALGVPFEGVRLDSGDLRELSGAARRMLDAGGATEALIFASGDIDEWAIEELKASGAPIDAYGVGTRLSTSADAPYVGGVYKLVEVADASGVIRPTFKASSGKATYPGRKQILRSASEARLVDDLVALHEEDACGREPLLRPVMRAGEVVDSPTLEVGRERLATQLGLLPEAQRGLQDGPPYPVRLSDGLRSLGQRVGLTTS